VKTSLLRDLARYAPPRDPVAVIQAHLSAYRETEVDLREVSGAMSDLVKARFAVSRVSTEADLIGGRPPGIAICRSVAVEVTSGEASMEKVTTIGLDIAKQLFQVHGVNGAGAIVCRRRLRRDVVGSFKVLPPCLIGIEACATGHHWARVLLALGHEARLMPALTSSLT
jgi:hypothetical protein